MKAPEAGAKTTADRSAETEDITEQGKNAELQSKEAGEGTDSLSHDVIFGVLASKRRRDVLRYVDETGGETTLSEVAEHIAAMENGIEPHQLSSEQRKRLYVSLYQSHLPKMDDESVIDFNQTRGTIELRSEAEQLFRYLAVDQSGTGTTLSWKWVPGSNLVTVLGSKLAEWV